MFLFTGCSSIGTYDIPPTAPNSPIYSLPNQNWNESKKIDSKPTTPSPEMPIIYPWLDKPQVDNVVDQTVDSAIEVQEQVCSEISANDPTDSNKVVGNAAKACREVLRAMYLAKFRKDL